MPIFEFECDDCHRRFSALVGVIAKPKPASCPNCKGSNLNKLVSRFSRVRSEDDAMEGLANEAVYSDIENDPVAMRKWMHDMSTAMDEDMDDEIEQSLEEEFSTSGVKSGSNDETVY